MSDSLQPYELSLSRLLCPWDSPGKNTGDGCHALLQGIFPTQRSNPLMSPALPGRFFTTSATWEAHSNLSKFTRLVTSRVRLLMWFFSEANLYSELVAANCSKLPDGHVCSFHLFLMLRPQCRGPCQAQRSHSKYLLNEGTKG